MRLGNRKIWLAAGWAVVLFAAFEIWKTWRDSQPPPVAAKLPPIATPDPDVELKRRKIELLTSGINCAELKVSSLVGQDPRILPEVSAPLRWLETIEIDPKLALGDGVWKLSWLEICGHAVVTLDGQLDHLVVDALDLGPLSDRWTTQKAARCREKTADPESNPPGDVVATGLNAAPTPPEKIWRADTVARRFQELAVEDWNCEPARPLTESSTPAY